MKLSIHDGPNNAAIFRRMRDIPRLTNQGIRRAFYKLGKDLKATAKRKILEKNKGGHLYKINLGGNIIRHRASAPGQAPANLSGALWRSVDVDVHGAYRMEFGYKSGASKRSEKTLFLAGGGGQLVGDGVSYGKYLEEGTRKMARRPGLLLSIKENGSQAIEHFETELKRALKKLGPH